MYKVFVNKKVIYIASSATPPPGRSRLRIFPYKGPKSINEAFTTLINLRDINGILIHDEDVENLWENFLNQFLVIEAAGGLVTNAAGEYLFIYRYGKWDLPKGKIEKGESREIASIREVQEECGLTRMKISERLPQTCHIYELEGNFVLKLTHWFSMTTDDDVKLKPQKEEGITRVKWFSREQIISEVLKNTYPSVKELVNNAIPSGATSPNV